MKKMIEKATIISIAALFISISALPAMSTEIQTKNDLTVPIELTSVQEDGTCQTETYDMTYEEMSRLLPKLRNLIDLLNGIKDKNTLLDILLELLGGNQNSLLGRLINYLITSGIAYDGQIVMSCGWGYNLNPLKDAKTDFVKPITMWHYSKESNMYMLPSTTAILQFSPFKFKTVGGSQFGFMFRFRGVYIHIPEQIPNQSFTFFIGSAKHIINVELPNITLPEGIGN